MELDTTTVSAELVLLIPVDRTRTLQLPQHKPHEPEAAYEIWALADGRWAAQNPLVGLVVRDSMGSHGAGKVVARGTNERRQFEVPRLVETFGCAVDWAAVHDACAAMDRVRRDGPVRGIGTRVTGDALGGTYHHTGFRGLQGLVRIAVALEEIAQDAWKTVHAAGLAHDMERGRHGVRVALAVARVRELLVGAGVMPKGARLCSAQAPGYGLAGLGWLCGYGLDRELPHGVIEAFAAGYALPKADLAGAVSA